GTNALLRTGANCCRGADDILEDLEPQIVETAAAVAAAAGRTPGGAPDGSAAAGATSGDERKVIAALTRTRGRDLGEIGRATGLTPAGLQVVLLGLELRGIVVTRPGPRYFLRG